MLNKVCPFYTGKSHPALLNGNFTNWACQVLWANILKTSSLLLKYGHPANSYQFDDTLSNVKYTYTERSII